MKKEKKPKKDRPLDLHSYLVGKLRAATRKWPVFNKAKADRKIKVSVEYLEHLDGTKWLKSTIQESKFGYAVGDIFMTRVYKKAQSRERVMYCCAKCGELFFDYLEIPKRKGGLKKTAMLAIDHVDPVVPIECDARSMTWDEYISRMFEGELQILCNYPGVIDGCASCHHIKTKQEQEARAEYIRQKDLTDAARNDNRIVVLSDITTKETK